MSYSQASAQSYECTSNGSSLQGNLIKINLGSVYLPSLELFMLLLSKKREKKKKLAIYLCDKLLDCTCNFNPEYKNDTSNLSSLFI